MPTRSVLWESIVTCKRSLKKMVLDLFCAVWCGCESRIFPMWRISFDDFIFNITGDFMATVPATGGPFDLEITGFVDNKGNPTTEADVPTWASSDDTIATVAVDVANPQKAVATLTGKTGQVQLSASFADETGGGSGPAYVVTGMLDVLPGAAVSATMGISGPGL